MQPTYFASFLLGAKQDTPSPAIADVNEVIFDWIFNNPRRQLSRPAEWPSVDSSFIKFPGNERVQYLQFESENAVRATAIRFEHPDDQHRFWRTDCVLDGQHHTSSAVRFSVTVAVGSVAPEMFPKGAPRSRPRIVTSILQRFGGREALPLTSNYLNVFSEETERFAAFLFDPDRAMPIIFASRRNSNNSVLCDAADLADKLAGIAYVCVAADSDVSREMMRHMDNSLNTYDGGVRIYWPSMKQTDTPYRHRLWTPQTLAAMQRARLSLSDQLLRTISATSVMRRVSGIGRWEDIEREIARLSIETSTKHSSSAATTVPPEWLKQYEADIDALRQKNEELEILDAQLREKEEELRQWKQLYLHSIRTKASDEKDIQDTEDFVFTNSMDVINAVQKQYEDSLYFIDGRISKECEQFEELERLYAACTWLATTYRKAKLGVEKCTDFDTSCREVCGFRYSAHQSSVTMGMFASDYEISWQGKNVKLEEHIGYGSSTEPRFTIRMAFFFDSNLGKVIVGYVGQHQANRKSN